MTASAIREAAANFDQCVAAMWPDAARRNISQASFQRFTSGLEPDLRIMDLMDSQPEFTKAIWDYLDILVNDNRLAKGREILPNKPQLTRRKAYGAPRFIIASIGHRSITRQMGDRSVLNSTATLACIGLRQNISGTSSLRAGIRIAAIRPEQRGSWLRVQGRQLLPTRSSATPRTPTVKPPRVVPRNLKK
jgi:membrane-bound lytic murein transglycosylase B